LRILKLFQISKYYVTVAVDAVGTHTFKQMKCSLLFGYL